MVSVEFSLVDTASFPSLAPVLGAHFPSYLVPDVSSGVCNVPYKVCSVPSKVCNVPSEVYEM